MLEKPIISIDKFSGFGETGIIYCEGVFPEVDNGKSVMSEGFTPSTKFNSSTTGFSNLSQNAIWGGVTMPTIHSTDAVYNLYIDSGTFQRIYAYQSIGSEIKNGQVHINQTTDYCRYPDIIETYNGNILFPSEKYIGRGLRFKATGGSTTTIIDTTKNFVTLGYAVNDKVTNLKTGIEYTISSISTTTNTNDTLNFTASGTNTTSANDECIAWEDNRLETNLSRAVWQQPQTDWVKQFRLYGSQYLVTNGNYLAMISADEGTIDKTYKQLPFKHQALCFDVNNEKVLVSANYNGRGVLLLWDGSLDGWNNTLEFDLPITSLVSYGSSWVFVSNGGIYITDGWQIQKLYSANNAKKTSSFSINPASHNGLVIYGNILYIANNSSDLNLVERGIYAIDLSNLKSGFTLIKILNGSKLTGAPFSVFLSNLWLGYQVIEVGHFSGVNVINYGSAGGNYIDKSFIIGISLPEERQIKGVGLNISRYLKDYNNDVNNELSRYIQVSVGDGNRGLISRAQTISVGSPTTTFIVNENLYLNNKIGDQIYINDRDEDTYGERTFITSKSGSGTSVTWGISPALSTTHTDGTEMKMIRVKKFDKKLITYDNLKNEIVFYGDGITSNKIFIEVVIFGQSNAMPLNINDIKVYGA